MEVYPLPPQKKKKRKKHTQTHKAGMALLEGAAVGTVSPSSPLRTHRYPSGWTKAKTSVEMKRVLPLLAVGEDKEMCRKV